MQLGGCLASGTVHTMVVNLVESSKNNCGGDSKNVSFFPGPVQGTHAALCVEVSSNCKKPGPLSSNQRELFTTSGENYAWLIGQMLLHLRYYLWLILKGKKRRYVINSSLV